MATILQQHGRSEIEYHATTLAGNGRVAKAVAENVALDAWYIKAGVNWLNQAGSPTPQFFSLSAAPSLGGGFHIFIGHGSPFDVMTVVKGTPAVLPAAATWSLISQRGVETPFVPVAFNGSDQSSNFFESAGPTNEAYFVAGGRGEQRLNPDLWGPFQLTLDSVDLGKRYWIHVQTPTQPTNGGLGAAILTHRRHTGHATRILNANVWDDGGDGSYVEMKLETRFSTSGEIRAFWLRSKPGMTVPQLSVDFPGGVVIPRNMNAYFRIVTDSTNSVGNRKGTMTYFNGKGVG